jgi:hypothetical protein
VGHRDWPDKRGYRKLTAQQPADYYRTGGNVPPDAVTVGEEARARKPVKIFLHVHAVYKTADFYQKLCVSSAFRIIQYVQFPQML